MRKIFIHWIFTLLLVSYSFLQPVFAQKQNQNLSDTISHRDSLFWEAYNSCDTAKYQQFIMNDVEFYHDKGGITLGLEKLLSITKKNLCGTNNFRLRREAVPGTVRIFPMQSSDGIYGAIISGDHVFYIREGTKESSDGLAKFTHLWLLKDGTWKMARILSYDHRPAPLADKKKQIALSDKVLDQYSGNYKGPKTGVMTVTRLNGTLNLSIQEKKFTLYPETENLFFIKDRDLKFEFIKNQSGIFKMVVRENGQIMEEAIFSKKK